MSIWKDGKYFWILKNVFISNLYIENNLYIEAPFLWIMFNCLNGAGLLREDSLLFTIKLPVFPGTHLIHLGKMEGCAWSHPMFMNLEPIEREFNVLTNRPLEQLYPKLYYIWKYNFYWKRQMQPEMLFWID